MPPNALDDDDNGTTNAVETPNALSTRDPANAPDPAPQAARSKRRRRRGVAIALLLAYVLAVMFGGCADMLVLYPTTDPIACDGAECRNLPVPGSPNAVACYSTRVNVPAGAEPDAYLLIFDGNGGRAESAVTWGGALAQGRAVEVWAVNYPGYGSSPGKARLKSIPPAALAAYDAIRARAGSKPVVIWGASLGTAAALHVSANRPDVSGLVLTNPPPLRQLILQRHGWWNLWLAAVPVALGIPKELDSITNAAATKVPALILSADADSIVPPEYQRMVSNAYAGPKHVVNLPGADHNTPASQAAPEQWQAGLEWLWGRVMQPP